MTDNTQPEALRTIKRFYRGTDCMAENQAGDWVRYEDHVAAATELRRQHARIAELEAELEAVGAGGVQALSAAPEAIAKLRHLYQNMVNGAVRDTASAKRIAEGLLAPAIEALERATPPAEQQATKETSGGFHVWRDISTAPKDGSRFVATGHNYGLYSEGRHICVAQWFRGCWMETSDWNEASELQHLTHWLPLPSPPDDVAAPAEQQAAPKAVPAAVGHDEDLLEKLYWEFDSQRKKTGEERLAFKGKMRSYASEFRRRSVGQMVFAQSVSDDMMNLADRLGSEFDDVDPRAWKHLLVYAPKAAPGEPVAWRISDPNEPDLGFWLAEEDGGEGFLSEPLYTRTAPQAAGQDARPCHVFTVRKAGGLTEWEPTTMALALPDGAHALYTLPQPSPHAQADSVTAPAVASEPIAYLYDDGSWTPAKTEEGHKLNDWMISAGSPKIGVHLASTAQPTPLTTLAQATQVGNQQEAREPVSPRHPVVMQWRDNAIEACAKIADAYGHEHAAQDMRAMLTAPQQEAQEPAFWMNEKGHTWSHSDWKQFPKHRAKYPIPLYPHFPAPQPAPAPLSDDAKDAARYRWLRATTNFATNSQGERIDVRNQPEKWDAAIDAALAAQRGE